MTKALILLVTINMAPLMTTLFQNNRFKHPLDGNGQFLDGRPLLGPHKTRSGFLFGVFAGGVMGGFLDLPLWIGPVAGFLGMIGDSFSSFIKRRTRKPPGTNLPVVDQMFEAGFPLLFLHGVGVLSFPAALAALFVFIGIGWGGTSLRGILFTPSPSRFPKVVRSKYPFREWRACHIALSPFARFFNFENVLFYRVGMAGVFKLVGLYARGLQNALDVRLNKIVVRSVRVPASFDDYRILFISDLHIDGMERLSERLIQLVKDIEVDLCIFGGDYRMEMYGAFTNANRKLKGLVPHIQARDGVFGVLGNHDCLEIAPELEDVGICMLINDSVTIRNNGDAVSIVGLDDPHYYKCHDLDKAFADVPKTAFAILAAHSPEIVMEIKDHRVDFCLCGHTHGGQIRLPGIGPVFTHSKAPRSTSAGLWQYNAIKGYTSTGAGSSGIPLRFHCPPEVVLVTLKTG